MKLYVAAGAINPDRVTYFLAEKGKLDAVEQVPMNLMEGDQKKADYSGVNPLQRVPSLVLDDGTVLTESRAICTYFEGLYPEPNLLGATPLEKAQIEMWDRRIEMNFMATIAAAFRHGAEVAKVLEPVQVSEWAALNHKQIPAIADMFDARLGESEFVAGDRFTNADISLFLTLGFARYLRFKATDGRENLKRWFDQVKDRDMSKARG